MLDLLFPIFPLDMKELIRFDLREASQHPPHRSYSTITSRRFFTFIHVHPSIPSLKHKKNILGTREFLTRLSPCKVLFYQLFLW